MDPSHHGLEVTNIENPWIIGGAYGVYNLDFESGMVRVTGKGKKERIGRLLEMHADSARVAPQAQANVKTEIEVSPAPVTSKTSLALVGMCVTPPALTVEYVTKSPEIPSLS